MGNYLYIFVMGLFMMAACSCSDGNDGIVPGDIDKLEPENPVPPQGTDWDDFADTGIEYDDGKNIVFHVKIAIDKESWDLRGENFFKSNLKKQFEEINTRFNGLDKKGMLKRNYIFIPDLEDIIVYDRADLPDMPWDAHARVIETYPARIDKQKFQVVVQYDCYIQPDEVGRGGGHGDNQGISSILVISPGEDMVEKFKDVFTEEANTAAAITHEFGHARGVVDTYLTRVSANNNPIYPMGYEPEKGNMNNPYPKLENCEWSEYEMRVINYCGAKKQQYMLHHCMNDLFPDYIEFTINDSKAAPKGYSMKIYKEDNYKIVSTPIHTFQIEGNLLRKSGHEIFWHGNVAWYYYNMVFIEVTNIATGKKGYTYLPAYIVHNQGLIDHENGVSKSTYKCDIEIKNG